MLTAYFAEYREWAVRDPGLLNNKIARDVFSQLLDQIGERIIQEAKSLSSQLGTASQFLADNPLPKSLAEKLPGEFRVYCLALNALKQWVSAEQAATDRYLLGGTARKQCRAAAANCILSGDPLTSDTVELHHPVRDGRPPIPVSKAAHARLEGQVHDLGDESLQGKLLKIKRNRSWVHLRRGCLDLLHQPVQHSTPQVGASSRSFARKAAQETAKSCQELLDWLDENKLGLEPTGELP